MATAIGAGAAEVITCREVDLAMEIANRIEPRPLLCGERDCVLIPGFDLGNSPAEYSAENVVGKTLILTTTNGTAAIETAASAPQVVVASFLNLSAVVELLQSYQSIRLICAGTNGFLSNEDILVAGALIFACETRYGAESDGDASILARQLWLSRFPADQYSDDHLPSASDLAEAMRETRGGRNLIRVGYEHDIRRCAEVDSLATVPRLCGRDPLTFA